jgi:hypothetical protein
MKTLRNTLLAACLAAGALPALAATAESDRAAEAKAAETNQEVEKKLADARTRLEAAAREVAELSGQMGRNYSFRFGGPEGGPQRALLGVLLDPSTQKDGAHVREVSPGGAAAEAGIKAGDIITSIGGQDLTKEADAGQALVEKMGQIEPNLKIQLGVLREGRKLNVDVTPRPAPRQAFAFQGPDGRELGERMRELRELHDLPRGGSIDLRRLGPPGPMGGPVERREIIINRGGEDGGTRFEGMEFATLSEKLGGYFGVKSGVLVVRAGASSPWKLQDGDVILSIDGRAPSNAQHAGRILRSYSSGEKLKLRVQRDRKAQDIEVMVPGGRDGD